MTTGRINQVTFLSERDVGPGGILLRTRALRPVHTKGPKPLGVVFRTNVGFNCYQREASKAGLFGFSETSTTLLIVQSSVTQGGEPRYAAFRRTNVYCKLS
jgi:hypothetical protein